MAVYWSERAAWRNDRGAQYILGQALEKGEGIGVDREQARFWYRKAADQGEERARQALAVGPSVEK